MNAGEANSARGKIVKANDFLLHVGSRCRPCGVEQASKSTKNRKRYSGELKL
jgi:hypothetical protein